MFLFDVRISWNYSRDNLGVHKDLYRKMLTTELLIIKFLIINNKTRKR